jgi:hypothetical protein
MGAYAHITRCAELSEDDIVSALEDRRSAKMLLERLARVAQPNEGAPKVLHFLARMAKAVDWIDGTLHVELIAEGDAVRVNVLSDVGIGMQERLFPSFKMAARFEEFTRMVELMPRRVEPLAVVIEEVGRLVLAAEVDARWPTSIPKAVPIAEDSLYRRKGSRPKMEASDPPPRSISSAKMRAVRRASRPDGSSALRAASRRSEVDAPNSGPPSGKRNVATIEGSVESQRGGPQSVPEIVIPTISARSGKTLRPLLTAARPSSHKHTLRPDSNAVPPPTPAVPPAPRIPRVDSGEPGAPNSERVRMRARRRSLAKVPVPEAPPRPRRGSKQRVDPKGTGGPSAPPQRSKSSGKIDAVRLDSTSSDLDWEIPPTGMPPPNGPHPKDKGAGARSTGAYPIPPIPGPALTPQIPAEADSHAGVGSEEATLRRATSSERASRVPAAAKGERGRAAIPRDDPREDTEEEAPE